MNFLSVRRSSKTNTQCTAAVKAAPNIRVTPIATLLGEAIARTANEKSVSSLFY